MTKIYDDIRRLYERRGLASRVGFGSRPAVLVVDFIRGFTESESPLASDLDGPLTATAEILHCARQVGVPIYFTTVEYDPDMQDAGLFPRKVPSLQWLVRGSRWVEIDPRLELQANETIIRKKYASAFFRTELSASLAIDGIDTLVITGCTTSGCVRASTVDALQHGFHAIVPAEAVGDRAQLVHEVNLFDIDAKYGDVVQVQDVLRYLLGLDRGQRDA